MSTPVRAPFSEDLISLRDQLPELLPLLEAKSHWYGSIYFERKSTQIFSANLKQTSVSDQKSRGAVLRIYDGVTLFEQATDELDFDDLKTACKKLADRAARAEHSRSASLLRRPYTPPTWKERLAPGLDPEIVSQIPAAATAQTPVHFGIRYEVDPRPLTSAQRLERLRQIISRCQELAPQASLTREDLSFITARQSIAVEESLFVDRESCMSQTLFRLGLTVIAMSGAERSVTRVGGLGGLETTDFTDKDALELLQELRAMKNAEALTPGKYRVLFGPWLTGILAHEAFGHSQEADTCARGRSKAWDLHKNSARVGNEHATIINNPAAFTNGTSGHGAWGSYFFDEEGWLSQEQVLLERGYLHAPMTNLTSALRLGIPRSANGKRESWANGVYTRQTNTYFSAGKSTLNELMEEMGDGFLATSPAGGMEDPKGMGIQVGIHFLQEVKNGKLTGRVFKGPSKGDIQLTGYVPDILEKIMDKSKIDFDAPEADHAQHPFNAAGGCAKYHKEFVHAGCGGPYVLLDQVTLG